ncbi:MAG: preprotein translocase subunit SecG [Bacteroidia bacterium]|jgi:preprotein translocase subunit SecG
MSTVFSLLILITCILLILIVLVQNSKGGGLSSTFSASNQVMGVRKTTDFLEKATWTLAGTLIVLCLLATALKSSSDGGETETISTRKAEEGTSAPTPAPAAPKAPAPKAPTPAPTAP